MSMRRDMSHLEADIQMLSEEDDQIRELVDALRTVSNDPEFILGAVTAVMDDEDDLRSLLYFIENDAHADRSSILGFAVELEQAHHEDDPDYFAE